MPIRTFINGYKFDPEAIRVMGVAYEMARAAFPIGQKKIADEFLAGKIIEIAAAGETNPDNICEQALIYFANNISSSA